MAKQIKFLEINATYKGMIGTYNKKDAIWAFGVYILVMISYYIMGVLYSDKNVYLGYQINVALAVICVIIVLIRKQKLKSIGFDKIEIKKSFVFGIVLALFIFLVDFIPGYLAGYEMLPLAKLFSNFLYYFFIIALVEEIVFRGFIQTRIYGIIKNPILSILVTAFLFMTMHIPFQMGAAHVGVITYISTYFISLFITFLWHIVFNFMYAKYNSIAAPTIFHAVLDWANYLFIG